MSAGKRNRLVTIQRRVTSATDTGSRNVSWETFAQVYAEKRDNKTGASENTMSSTQYPILRAEWVIRFLPGITPSMRVVYEGETWEIINIADDSFRRDYKVLLCELRGNGSTSGGLTCQPATYQNAAEDATFTQTIQSGAVFTADPITVTEVDGSTRTELANEDVTCAFIEIEVFDTEGRLLETVTEYPEDGRITVPAASGSATYSNGGDFTQEIDAGDTFTAPQIEVTDVDGSTRASLPNIGVVCEWKVLQVQLESGSSLTSVDTYPSGGIVTILKSSIPQRYLDVNGVVTGWASAPFRSRIQVLNAVVASIAQPDEVFTNLTIEVNVPVVNSAGDGVGGNVTDLLNPHDLPDVPLTDDNGAVGSYPMPTSIVVTGQVNTASYSSGVLTIDPQGGGSPTAICPAPIFATQANLFGETGFVEGAQIAAGVFDPPTGAFAHLQGLDYTASVPFVTLKHSHLGGAARWRDSANNPLAYGDATVGDGLVTDLNFDRQWYIVRTTVANLQAALDYAAAATFGGHSDWRLPIRAELWTLFDLDNTNNISFPNGRPPGFDSNSTNSVISCTTAELGSTFVYATFGTNRRTQFVSKTASVFVILVRNFNSY
jgi:head-tail adaptor